MASDPRVPRKSTTRRVPAAIPVVPPTPILSWILEAACADADPETFSAATPEAEAEAKAICAGCPVLRQCRDYALATAQEWGIWGGLSEAERSALRDPEQHGPEVGPLRGTGDQADEDALAIRLAGQVTRLERPGASRSHA
jgi:WhiB family transcriptional regulator, redox-sensing transcriptional regulator